MPLSLNDYVNSVLATYVDKREQTYSFLIYGNSGVGKTYSLKTAPRPVLLHSFDPGGWKTLREEVEAGDIIVDSRFESGPNPFALWEKVFFDLVQGKVFEHFATYAIDSGTFWANAMLEALAAYEGAKTIQLQHYKEQQRRIGTIIKTITGLPCHFVLTGHVESERDETDGKIKNSIMVSGKAKVLLPMNFDEVYCLHSDFKDKKEYHYFQVKTDGKFTARSRILKNIEGAFLDDASFETVFKKGNVPFVNKPKIKPEGGAKA